MNANFVSFDDVQDRVADVLRSTAAMPAAIDRLYLVRDLLGRVRIAVSDAVEEDKACQDVLKHFARNLHRALGPHGYDEEEAVLFVDEEMLEELSEVARLPDLFVSRGKTERVYWVERLLTGHGWWSLAAPPEVGAQRFTLYSVKGGVGRSTTAAVLAWHLARNGQRVLVLDLDLESPGLSSAMLDARRRPRFGVADWFVEDLVGQGDHVAEEMAAAPAWAQDFDGDVRVVPAYGSEPGEYLAKLGRVYMDTQESWAVRLNRLVWRLEEVHKPSVVLLESRSGLHDIAAAAVTDLHAQVLLFALDSDSHWADYTILFRHWQEQEVAAAIRERLSIVSALTLERDTEAYLQSFRERAWDLFREHLYDDVLPSNDPSDLFSFDIHEDDAPHDPLVIHWTRGLAAGASLRDPERITAPVQQAYASFLTRFDAIAEFNDGGEAR